MGQNEVNVCGIHQAYEAGNHGYTIVLGLGAQSPFHSSCPLMTVAQARAAWDEARNPSSTPTSLMAVLPPAAATWLNGLGTVVVNGTTVDLKEAALYAAGLGPRPTSITVGPHSPPY